MFWSTDKLRRRVTDERIIQPYFQTKTGRSNYTLCLGDEAFVSPTREPSNQSEEQTLNLENENSLVIPPGQFGFLLTQEIVKIPEDTIAFISMRARYKYKGLVNVSGFHVDPGFHGRLIFAVFNAGPTRVRLKRRDECFHIWFADLDQENTEGVKKGSFSIPSDTIGGLGLQLNSLNSLREEIDLIKADHHKLKHTLELFKGVVIALGVGMAIALLSWTMSYFSVPKKAIQVPTVSEVSSLPKKSNLEQNNKETAVTDKPDQMP